MCISGSLPEPGFLTMATTDTLVRAEGAQLSPPQLDPFPLDSRAGKRDSLAIRVAGNVLGLFAERGLQMAIGEELKQFAVDPNSADIRMSVAWTEKLDVPRREPQFDSGGLWSVFDEEGGYRFVFSSPSLGAGPYKAAWLDFEFKTGRLDLFRPYFDARRPVYPLEYPLDELVMIHRLARGEGVEIHGLGVVDGVGRGHLFVGHSGAGKSTLARLWQQEPGALILSDDRIILRECAGQIWMHGTPWHGDVGVASPQAAPLHRAYLIEHGSRCELIELSKAQAAAEFLARCFVPHYSAEAMDFSLQFLGRVARETPCFLFRFLPDCRAVEAICRAAA